MTTGQAEVDLSRFTIPLTQPVVLLDCEVAFESLTQREKHYAHYLSKAAWWGGLIVPVQVSPESPAIFAILLDIFQSNGVAGLKKIATEECNFSEDDWKALLVYTTGLFSNAGNYKSFGDTKFIPGVSATLVESLISKAKFFGLTPEAAKETWDAVKGRVYSLTDREKSLGLGESGTTTYFSANCTEEDSELINRFMKEHNLEGWMTRSFKTTNGGVNHYEIRTAAIKQISRPIKKFEGATFELTKGDYSLFLEEICQQLRQAKKYAANETEVSMIECYIKSFRKGNLEEHKNGSRFWIADKSPTIETYTGFIENYRDPAGIRAEFSAFVAMVNRPMSATFQALVDNATHFLTFLPWPRDFEGDTFLKPDFTSLDILSFSGSDIPAGINIPNYDEIRRNEGFKNVSMGNIIPASFKETKIPFLSPADTALFDKHRVTSFDVQVGLHELLGHGSGKLFTVDEKGVINFPAQLINPVTKEMVGGGSYLPGETYSSLFGAMSSAYEECRAESVGLYLSLYDEVLKIFHLEGQHAQEVKYANWISMVFGGAKALEMYSPESKAWGQAHSQARFVILQVLLEAGDGLVTVTERVTADGQPDLLISIDESKLDTVGRKAMEEFLIKLNVFKATADVQRATAMFDHYSAVHDEGPNPWGKWRPIIMANRQARKIFVQVNTAVEGDNVVLKNYEASHEGFIQSWIERFEGNLVYKALIECWVKDRPYF